MDKTRIIVVEDNIVYCEFVCNLLAREGFRTVQAYHLSTAKKLLQQASDGESGYWSIFNIIFFKLQRVETSYCRELFVFLQRSICNKKELTHNDNVERNQRSRP